MLTACYYTLDAPSDVMPLFARIELTTIMTERGVPIDLMDSEVSTAS